MKPIKFGSWTITYNPKPIPIRSHDFDVIHEDYDGECGKYYFTAASIEEAKAEIREREKEEEE